MRKVFITGATGFVGYHLLREMWDRDVEIWALCRQYDKRSAGIEKNGIHIVECRLEEVLRIPDICQERDFDAFYHLAWRGASGILRGDYNVQLDNVRWTCNCIEAAKRLRCKKIIVSGTVCEKQCDAILLQGRFAGASYYLLAKKHANELAKSISRNLGIPLIWSQFYHPIGIFNKKEQIVANTIQKLLHKEELKFGPAQELFDVIDVRDLAHAFYLMGDQDLAEDNYFIGSGNIKTLKEYLESIKDLVDPSAVMQYGAVNTAKLPMKQEWLDISAFCAETGFKPSITFSESVQAMKVWLENEEQYDSEKWVFSRHGTADREERE